MATEASKIGPQCSCLRSLHAAGYIRPPQGVVLNADDLFVVSRFFEELDKDYPAPDPTGKGINGKVMTLLASMHRLFVLCCIFCVLCFAGWYDQEGHRREKA